MLNISTSRVFKLVTLTALFVIAVLQAANGDAPTHCPNFCKCELHNERNRADCSAKRLISPNVEISAAVEILDLSYNDITYLDNTCFQNYYFLLNLTITHNAIQTIYLDAFSRLRRIRDIDLSYNRLESVDERLFELNRHLHTLSLEGNKFMSLPNQPLLRSTSLRALNLRNSQLNYISSDLLSALPQLQQLDVSQNLMITLNTVAFNAPRHLQQLNLNENRWICDQTLKQSVERLRQKKIVVTLTDCDFQQVLESKATNPKFERLELLAPEKEDEKASAEVSAENSINTLRSDKSAANKWRQLPQGNEYADYDYDDQEVKVLVDLTAQEHICYGSRAQVCQRYRKCLEQVSHILLQQIRPEPVEHAIYTSNDINFVFLLGAAAGIATVIFIVTCALCFKKCWEACSKPETKEIQQHRAEQQEAADSLEEYSHQPRTSVDTAVNTYSNPPPTRPLRRSTRRSTAPSRAVVRHDALNASGHDNFISRLFGRPARHQYYRTLNENTVTLIRRLSRSNLFINRERSGTTAPSTPSSPSSATPAAPFADEFQADAPAEYTRPETPPPKYRDVIVIDNCDRK